LDEVDVAGFYSDLERQVVEGRELIEREGVEVASVDVAYQADMAYEGQVHEVRAPLPARRCDRDGIREAFEQAYSAQYGNKISGRPVRIVTTRVSVIGVRRRSAEWNGFGSEAAPLDQASIGRRPVYFDNGFVECPVYERGLLGAGVRIDGPAVIEQPDSTTVVEPGTSAVVGPSGTLIVRVAA
jgi:N-methylhydantoinase A